MSNISIHSVVQDYIEDRNISGVDDSLLIRWLTDYDGLTGQVEEYVHRIALLYVDNYKAILPDGYKKTQQVVARTRKDLSCSRRESVSGWITHAQQPGCEVPELICTTCKATSCECNAPIYEVEIDRTWERGHPEHYLKGWSNFGSVGRGEGLKKENYGGWTWLRPAMDDFFREKYFLNDCVNFNTKVCGQYSFKLEPPYLTVDFPEGEIIISYLGKMLDEDGNIMIPDDAHYLEGAINHLDYKWFSLEASNNMYEEGSRARLFKQFANQAKRDREISISRYKSRTVVPDYKDWSTFTKKVMHQRIPDRRFDEGFKRGGEGIFERYSNLITKR